MDINILAVVSSWGEGFLERVCRPDSPGTKIVFVSPKKALEQRDFFSLAQEFDVVIVGFSLESDLVMIERRVAEQFLANGATMVFLISPLASFGTHFDGWPAIGENSSECLTRGVATIVTNPADRMVLREILPDRSCRDAQFCRNNTYLIYDPRWNRFFASSDKERVLRKHYKPFVFLGHEERQFCSSLESCLVIGRGSDAVDSDDIPDADLVISSSPDDLIVAACCRVPAVTLEDNSVLPSARLAFLWPAKRLHSSRLADFVGDPKSWVEIVSQQKILLSNFEVSFLGKVLERVLPGKVSLDSVEAFASTSIRPAS